MKNFKKMMQQAQAMQAKMLEAQEKLAEITVEGEAGGRMVTVTLNCKGEMQGLKIDPELIKSDEIDVLEDLIIAAFNDARSKVDARTSEEMSQITGGLPIPEGMGF